MRNLLLDYSIFDKTGLEVFPIDREWLRQDRQSMFLRISQFAGFWVAAGKAGEIRDTIRRAAGTVYWELEIRQNDVKVMDYLHPAAEVGHEAGNFIDLHYFDYAGHKYKPDDDLELKRAAAPAERMFYEALTDYDRGRREPGGMLVTAPFLRLVAPNVRMKTVCAAFVNRNPDQMFIPRRP